MANHQPPKPPPGKQPQPAPTRPTTHQSPPAPPRQPTQPAPHHGEPQQPLQPPLPPAQSSPPRQPAPDPPPMPDAPQGRDNPSREDDPNAAVALTPEQATGIVTTPQPPKKYRRPLPQPGDNDYVSGQPVNEEEAARIEGEEEERYNRALALTREAEASRSPAAANPPPREQHPASPPPRNPKGDKE